MASLNLALIDYWKAGSKLELLSYSKHANSTAYSSYVASHVHNLSNEENAIDLNPKHLKLETVTHNNSDRKLHHSRQFAFDHKPEDRCRFGAVWYNDSSITREGNFR